MMSKPRRNSLLQMIPFFEQVVQPTRVEMTKEAVHFCIKKKEELENPDRVERLYLHNKVTQQLHIYRDVYRGLTVFNIG